MPFHLGAFWENIDANAAFAFINAVADQQLTINGDDLRVPELDQLVAVAAGVCTGGNQLARLSSPTLRRLSRLIIEPNNGGAAADAEPDSPPAVLDLRRTPIKLRRNEQLNAEVHSDDAAFARDQWVLCWFADGPREPVGGEIFTVRGTAALAQTAGAWSNTALALDEDLPPGRYQVVGMRARAATLVGARLVFVGGGWRPGVIGGDDQQDLDHPMFRFGNFGVFGEFDEQSPPTVDFLSNDADAAQVVYLDLIQTAAA